MMAGPFRPSDRRPCRGVGPKCLAGTCSHDGVDRLSDVDLHAAARRLAEQWERAVATPTNRFRLASMRGKGASFAAEARLRGWKNPLTPPQAQGATSRPEESGTVGGAKPTPTSETLSGALRGNRRIRSSPLRGVPKMWA